MKFPRVSVALAATGLSLLVGCSTNEFGGGNKVPGPSSGNSQAAEQDKKSDGEQKTDDKTSEAPKKGDSDSKLDQKDETAAASYDADDTTKGCQLPADVRTKFMAHAGDKLGFALGWGDTGGSGGDEQLKLANVTMQDCSWFQKFKDSDAIYVVQFDERKQGAGLLGEVVQSYIEPFNGKSPLEFAQCLQAAAQAGATCHRVGDI